MRGSVISFATAVSVAIMHAAVSAQSPSVRSIGVPQVADAAKWSSILAAENARAATPAQLQLLLDNARNGSPAIRRMSVRALGRLQRADLVDSIAPYLHDASAEIRGGAARAIALASIADRAPVSARVAVRAALASERDPAVIAALAETLGRLRMANADSARIVAAEIAALDTHDARAMLGIARGLHFIIRQPASVRAGIDAAREALVRIATSKAQAPAADHARRIATETLALAGLGDEPTAISIFKDPDPLVRREAVMFAALPSRDTAVAHRIIDRGLHDIAWNVRFEALKQMGARFSTGTSCDRFAMYARDPNMHVKLAAIDMLAGACTPEPRTADVLDSIARTLRAAPNSEWHPAAHALVALAARSATRAAMLLNRFATNGNLFVRTYAANAAAAMKETTTLVTLAKDPQPNVRTAAIHGLRRILGHSADSIFISQLAIDDNQLLIEAAGALDSTTTPGAATALFDALDRFTSLERENSRDGRMALLQTIGHVGNASSATRLTSYLNDYDPQVAGRAAQILKTWTGTDRTPAPRLLPLEPLPTFSEIADLQNSRIIVEMENGATFTVRLLAFDAPVNAARFAHLARTGYFNGLTLHRIEPNFVVQGGSPHANEYTGAARFSRDELGYPNDRGTIGLSTRGHDTGDAQLYVNTIDNVQLDPFYTVFAEVVSGMDKVDGILEGAVIRKMTLTH